MPGMKIPQGDEDQFKAAANPEVSIERIDLDILMIISLDNKSKSIFNLE